MPPLVEIGLADLPKSRGARAPPAPPKVSRIPSLNSFFADISSFYVIIYYSGPSQVGGPGGPVPPHFLADQLTLSQPGGAHYPHLVLRAPPDFQTLRRP